MSSPHQSELPPNLVGQEVFDEIRDRLTQPPLTHLFDYSLDTTQARSLFRSKEEFRRNTIMVFRAIGKAMLVALELSENTYKPNFDGTTLAPQAYWAARFVIRFPPSNISGRNTRRFGAFDYKDILRGGMTSGPGDSLYTATYAYWQPPENRNTPLEPTVLTQAARWLGGFERDDSEPNFWMLAGTQFNESAAQMASLVAPSGFHNAARGLTRPPFIHHLAAATSGV